MAKDLFTGEVIGKDLFEERGIKVKTPTLLNRVAEGASKGVMKLGRLTTTENPVQKFLNMNEQQRKTIRGGLETHPNRPFGVNVAGEIGADVVDMFGDPKFIVAGGLGENVAGKVAERIATTPLGRQIIETQLPTFGKKLLARTADLPLRSIQPMEASKEIGEKLLPRPVARGIRKYQLARKGTQFEGIRQDLPPLQRIENLKTTMSEKPNLLLKQEQETLKQNLAKISGKEEQVIGSAKSAIEQNKVKLKEDLSNLTNKMNKEVEPLKKNIDIASQKSAITGKQQYPRIAIENSTAYGSKLDNVVTIAEQEGKLPTQGVLQGIFDKTDQELADTFIDTGKPFTQYEKIKAKYLGGLSSEANPESQALAKAMGLKKGQLKNAGIDWSRVDVGQSQFKPPDVNAPINLKELLKDIRSVSKVISSKAKGAERAFTDEDLAAVIFQKNIGEHLAQTYPEFAKLQKAYAPLIEQMKAGRKLLKPGEQYNLGEAPNVLKKPDIAQERLIGELEKGTPGFNKGLGKITQPITKTKSKLAGTEKGYEIARQRIEQMSNDERIMLNDLLKMREEAFAMAKEKVNAKSLAKQLEIKKKLDTITQVLDKRKVGISKLQARAKITGQERKALEGGGVHTEVGYSIRRAIQRLLFGGF